MWYHSPSFFVMYLFGQYLHLVSIYSYWDHLIRNGEDLGVAFDKVRIGSGLAYCPCVSGKKADVVFINAGQAPLSYPVEGYRPLVAPPTLALERATTLFGRENNITKVKFLGLIYDSVFEVNLWILFYFIFIFIIYIFKWQLVSISSLM